MALLKNITTEKASFEIDRASQGMIMLNIPKNAKIKVSQVSDNEGEKVRFPEMSVAHYYQLFLGISERPLLLVGDSKDTTYERFHFPFSYSGVLPFDEEVRYRVELTELGENANVDIYNFDSSRLGTPIRVKMGEIRKTLSDDLIVLGAETKFLFFPNGNPEKLEHFVAQIKNNKEEKRKVEISSEQIEAYDCEKRLTALHVSHDLDGAPVVDFEVGAKLMSYPVAQIQEISIHKPQGEEFVFYHVEM